MLDHEKLDVYTIALQVAALAYEIADQLPKGHAALADQLRRAGTSVPANIAEGCGRRHGKDRERFMRIARGSATETAALVDLCLLRMPNLTQAKQIKVHIVRVVQMLTKMS